MFVDPFQHLGMLVSSIVVDNDMDRFLLGHPDVDNGKEADELLMAMMLHTLANDLALKHIERGEQSGDAVTLVVVGHGASPTLFHRPGWVRSSAWIWLFSSTESTMAWSGGLTYKPTISLSLAANCGSLDSLKRRTRCGRRP